MCALMSVLPLPAAPLVGAGLLALGGPPFVYAACLGLAAVGLGLILWLLSRPEDQFSGI